MLGHSVLWAITQCTTRRRTSDASCFQNYYQSEGSGGTRVCIAIAVVLNQEVYHELGYGPSITVTNQMALGYATSGTRTQALLIRGLNRSILILPARVDAHDPRSSPLLALPDLVVLGHHAPRDAELCIHAPCPFPRSTTHNALPAWSILVLPTRVDAHDSAARRYAATGTARSPNGPRRRAHSSFSVILPRARGPR